MQEKIQELQEEIATKTLLGKDTSKLEKELKEILRKKRT
jgi:hypothetical protein